MTDGYREKKKVRLNTEGATTETKVVRLVGEDEREGLYVEDRVRTEVTPMLDPNEYVLIAKAYDQPSISSEPTHKVDHGDLIRRLRKKRGIQPD